MLKLLLILILIACVILTLIVIAQNPKGGGLSSAFGGGMASNVMGVKQTTNFLEKTTWIIAVGIMVIVIFTNFFLPERKQNKEQKSVMEKFENTETLPQSPPPKPKIQEGDNKGNQNQGGGSQNAPSLRQGEERDQNRQNNQ